jgi:hypothetical protein
MKPLIAFFLIFPSLLLAQLAPIQHNYFTTNAVPPTVPVVSGVQDAAHFLAGDWVWRIPAGSGGSQTNNTVIVGTPSINAPSSFPQPGVTVYTLSLDASQTNTWLLAAQNATNNLAATNDTRSLFMTNNANVFAGTFFGTGTFTNFCTAPYPGALFSEGFGNVGPLGVQSTAVGDSAGAFVQNGSAFGFEASVSGAQGTALGSYSTVSGANGTAIGYNASAGANQISLGNNAVTVVSSFGTFTGNGGGLTNITTQTLTNANMDLEAGTALFRDVSVQNTNTTTHNWALYGASREVRSNYATGSYFIGTNGSGFWINGLTGDWVNITNGTVTATGGQFNGNAAGLTNLPLASQVGPLFTNVASTNLIWTNVLTGTWLGWVPGVGLVESNAITGTKSLLVGTNGGFHSGGWTPVGPGNITADSNITATVSLLTPQVTSGSLTNTNNAGIGGSLTVSNVFFTGPAGTPATDVVIRQYGTNELDLGFTNGNAGFVQILRGQTNINSANNQWVNMAVQGNVTAGGSMASGSGFTGSGSSLTNMIYVMSSSAASTTINANSTKYIACVYTALNFNNSEAGVEIPLPFNAPFTITNIQWGLLGLVLNSTTNVLLGLNMNGAVATNFNAILGASSSSATYSTNDFIHGYRVASGGITNRFSFSIQNSNGSAGTIAVVPWITYQVVTE